jgi:hypothetical protein
MMIILGSGCEGEVEVEVLKIDLVFNFELRNGGSNSIAGLKLKKNRLREFGEISIEKKENHLFG